MRRQRADGSWTFTTPDWDARWYWPAGTRVQLQGQPGVILKSHRVTVDVQTDAGRTHRVAMTFAGLVRVTEGQ